jgi:hypothetical protein
MKSQTFKILGFILLLLVFIAVILTPIRKKTPLKKPPVEKVRLLGAKIVIVIDDWGYHLTNLSIIKQIKQPLTCAILPGLKNSNLITRELNNLGCEIILHLPMEPKEKYNLEKNTITIAMDVEQVHNILEQDLFSVPFAKGISNHMGSRITEDKAVSTMVMAEAKKRGLYFFDSFVTSASVCTAVAKQVKIKFAKRDIFLDNQDDFGYIKSQLLKLKNLARRQGTAIGIGHDRRNTLLVLKEMLPKLEKEGYKFILLSQVVQ